MDHICILQHLIHGAVCHQFIVVMVNGRTDQVCFLLIGQSKLMENLSDKLMVHIVS